VECKFHLGTFTDTNISFSLFSSWITCHGESSFEEFEKLERAAFRRPLLLHAENPNNKFPAYIDVDSKFR
jgi:hypothetical protein